MTPAELEAIRAGWPAGTLDEMFHAVVAERATLLAEVDRVRALAEGWRREAAQTMSDAAYVSGHRMPGWLDRVALLGKCAAEVLRG